MVPKVVEECSWVDGRERVQRAFVIVVAFFFYFNCGRDGDRLLVNACLVAPALDTEANEVDVGWAVEKAVEAFAFERVVLLSDFLWLGLFNIT